MPIDDWIEVGVFARGPDEEERTERALYLERQRITQGRGTINVTVDEMPYDVGFDPYNKLIDLMPDDNRKTVDVEEQGNSATTKT